MQLVINGEEVLDSMHVCPLRSIEACTCDEVTGSLLLLFYNLSGVYVQYTACLGSQFYCRSLASLDQNSTVT